jgi:hypothetical protein
MSRKVFASSACTGNSGKRRQTTAAHVFAVTLNMINGSPSPRAFLVSLCDSEVDHPAINSEWLFPVTVAPHAIVFQQFNVAIQGNLAGKAEALLRRVGDGVRRHAQPQRLTRARRGR